MHIEWTAARMRWMQIYFPGLTHAVRLDEMSLVVHVKSVIGCEIFEISNERCYVDDCHGGFLARHLEGN